MVCKVDEFKCGNVCVRNNWKCDGEVDCPDAEDEQNCNDTCREWQFQVLALSYVSCSSQIQSLIFFPPVLRQNMYIRDLEL